ncbi:TLD family protein [Tritrichomonas foetus]|uniref:TLD family protein n=1 Tax=Tritrichomonas foetus TaxID=1144522 RepID=A0A1J4JD39_9EUKA|nr:TLD family protein [Tritrichomonas foetus]|eukprot:OHS95325.1 TLD family protein [Tritrichomonas foetus]
MFVQQFDFLQLDSPVIFGLFDQSCTTFTPEWLEEDKQREIKFPKMICHPQHNLFKIDDNFRKAVFFNGVPHRQRRKYWFIASSGLKLLIQVGNTWEFACQHASMIQSSSNSLFCGRLDILNFLPPAVLLQIETFLHIFWTQNNTIEFSPLIPIVASLLLLYMEPSLAYLSLQAMVNKSKMQEGWFFCLDKKTFLAQAKVFPQICEKRVKNVTKHARIINVNIEAVFISFVSLFFFPFVDLQTALTLFDIYLIEGRRFLIQFLLALFQSEEKILLQTNNADDFIEVLTDAIERLNDLNSLKIFLIKNVAKASVGKWNQLIRHEENFIKSLVKTQDVRNLQIVSHDDHVYSAFKSKIMNFTEEELEFDEENDNFHNNLDYFSPTENQTGNIMGVQSMNNIRSNLIQATNDEIEAAQAMITRSFADNHLMRIHGGRLLTVPMFYSIRSRLSPVFHKHSCQLVFSKSLNGCSLDNLIFSTNLSHCPHILMIETKDSLIGALISDSLKNEYSCNFSNMIYDQNDSREIEIDIDNDTNQTYQQADENEKAYEFYGKPSTFVFNAKENEIYQKFHPQNKMYIGYAPGEVIIGGPNPAIKFKDGLNEVESYQCDTFGSPQLINVKEEIREIEVYRLKIFKKRSKGTAKTV